MVLVIVVIIIISLLLSRLVISLEYKRNNLKDRLEITISYYKVIKHTFHLSIVNISKTDKEYGFKITTNFNKQQEGFIDFKTISKIIKKFKFYYKLYKSLMDKIFKLFKDVIVVKKVNANVELGLQDNALTGIAVGVVYAILWNIFAAIFGNIKIKKHELLVNPNFKDLLIKVHISCIFTITLGNIIYIGLYITVLCIINYFNIINDYFQKISTKKAV